MCKLRILVEVYVGANFWNSIFDLRGVPSGLSKTPSRLAGVVKMAESQIFALFNCFLFFISRYS